MLINRTLLIGDDSSTQRMELHEILRHQGMSLVGQASNTDELLMKFEELLPDVVVLDVTLLGSTDALVAIRTMRRRHPPVAIFATGSPSQQSVIMEALSMGAVDFFLKPFRSASIKTSLQQSLG
jgi:two-component system, chemotaxis family, chemotaxis protein CheY